MNFLYPILLFILITPTMSNAHSPMWAEGYCDDSISQGANRTYYNRGAEYRWKNTLGDWRDKDNIMQGTAPYAHVSIPDLDQQQTFSIDITSLVYSWVNSSTPNQGLLIKSKSSGKTHIISKENKNTELTPVLNIQTSSQNYAIPVTRDTTLKAETFHCFGSDTTLTTTGNILLYFDLSLINSNDQILNAELSIATSEEQFGVSELEIYKVSISKKKYKGNNIANQYPNDYGISDDENIIFNEPFEDVNWASNWSFIFQEQNLELVTSNDSENLEALMGNSLQIKLPEGELSALNAGYLFEEKIGDDLNEVYFRYYLRFGSQWETLENGKLPGIAGTYSNSDLEGGWGGRASDGTNGWSARGTFKTVLVDDESYSNHVPIGNYLYHADQTSDYGDIVIYDGQQSGLLAKERWYSIEQYVKLNTPGENDGIIRAWIDGKIAYENSSLKFRNEKFEQIKIDRIWLDIYHGGVTPIDKDIYVYIDNIVVAKEYIGPISFDKTLPLAGTEPNKNPIIKHTTPELFNIEMQPFENKTFSADISDPDGDSLTIEWYVNGSLVATGQPNYEFTASYFSLGDFVVELKVIDNKNALSTQQWAVSVVSAHWSTIPISEDTMLVSYTFEAQGSKETFSVGADIEQNAYLKFDLGSNTQDEVKSAKLVLYDINQFSDLDLDIFTSDNDWFEGSHSHEGSTRTYSDYDKKYMWKNYMGDWIDMYGDVNGAIPFSNVLIKDIDTPRLIYIDVTELVKEAPTANNYINFVLKANSGKHDFYSKEATLQNTRPLLLIEK